MARIILNGEPGTTWTNNTGVVHWQLHCALINSCGVCLSYHMAIAEWWPLLHHRGCNCKVRPVAIGATASPWVDFREVLRELPESQHEKAIGRSAYKLLEAGVIKWEDVVTSARVRPLYEVVARERLSIETMVKAGVPRSIAAEVHGSVHTPEHIALEQHQMRMIANLRNAGLTDQQIKQGFAQGISKRVGPVLAPIPKAEKSKSPEPAITAGNVILERIKRGNPQPRARYRTSAGT